MNPYQSLWWEQSRSDHKVLLLLRKNNADPCHQLHYLQMVTEKLAKAYLWRSGKPPPKKHAGFAQFMKSLGDIHPSNRARLATVLGFKNFKSLRTWIRSALPLVYELERLCPLPPRMVLIPNTPGPTMLRQNARPGTNSPSGGYWRIPGTDANSYRSFKPWLINSPRTGDLGARLGARLESLTTHRLSQQRLRKVNPERVPFRV